jgi:hypothetical protein
MPKIDIDYSNTIIYKISCKDPSIKDVYVGHTTNFVQRKHSHKQNCVNEKSPSHKCKLYKVIRENGGWNNWIMEIIKFFNCKNQYEARIKEQECFVSLNATLNSIEPIPKPKNNNENKTSHKCDICNISCKNENLFNIHNQTKKHIGKITEKEHLESCEILKTLKGKGFCCEKCKYCSFNKKDYNRHLLTKKHKNNDTSPNLTDEKPPKNPVFVCKCGNEYKHRQSLFSHKKMCSFKPEETKLDTSLNNNVILDLLKQNQEFKGLIIEQNKQIDLLVNKFVAKEVIIDKEQNTKIN